ncbi:MAG: radical SAM protein [Proteobacteria bacterium]|nr:radical SAM protein [Pseudomonadota bacterium]
MSVEVRPLGVRCNLSCAYCYQNPQRDAGNLKRPYSVDSMIAAAERQGSNFTVFGGEPLLIPLRDLEQLWAFGHKRYGKNGIQTNGTLISSEHVAAFEKYNVHVGFSIDGPEELNGLRTSVDVRRTAELTRVSIGWLETLTRARRVGTSLIFTLHRANAVGDRLGRLLEWLVFLDALGLKSARVHLLESENEAVRKLYGLSTRENIAALRAIASLEKRCRTLRLDLFRDIRQLLLAKDQSATCVWNACDPLTTAAVQGIEGDGSSSNCGRTNKEGVDWVKAPAPGFERSLALWNTPQKFGGCSGCRWFLFCKGQCPGTSLEQDWRNRSEHCDVWRDAFEQEEKRLLSNAQRPISDNPFLRKRLEFRLVDAWLRRSNLSIARAHTGRC